MNKSSSICRLSYYTKMGYYVKQYDHCHLYQPISYIMNHNKNDNICKQHPTVHVLVNTIYNNIRRPIYQLK
jgi:hypothetical protein